MTGRFFPERRRLVDGPRDALVALVRFYRFAISPSRPGACRFEPSCSAYALQALQSHGAAAGSYLAAHRLLRCGPWCAGGIDPVPLRRPRLFSGLAADASPQTVSTPPAPP